MRILIDIGHAAHVHLFKNVIRDLRLNGHNIYVTVRQIPLAIKLLDIYKIPYYVLGNKSDTLKGKFVKQILYDFRMIKLVKDLMVDILVGSSITIAHVSKITKINSMWFDDDDDDIEPLITKYGHPFTTVLLSPDVLKGKRKRKDTIFYAGYHELAYLHPNYFQADPSVLHLAGIHEKEKYFILRFNSFKAHHDIGVKGLSFEDKRKLISYLSQRGKVFVTTEGEIESEFQDYRITIPPNLIHSFIYYSTMLIGDSQTMTSEAAVLGVPSVRCNSFAGRISYLDEEEHRYGLTFGFRPEQSDIMFIKIKELLDTPNLKNIWHDKQKKMLNDKINVSKFMAWIIEEYPESINTIKARPEYQYNFI